MFWFSRIRVRAFLRPGLWSFLLSLPLLVIMTALPATFAQTANKSDTKAWPSGPWKYTKESRTTKSGKKHVWQSWLRYNCQLYIRQENGHSVRLQIFANKV